MRRACDRESLEQAPVCVYDAQRPPAQRRRQHQAETLLDVVRAGRNACGPEEPAGSRIVRPQRAAVATGHEREGPVERHVLRWGIGPQRGEHPCRARTKSAAVRRSQEVTQTRPDEGAKPTS